MFLDTNAVHYARLFLKFAKEKGLPPTGSRTDDPGDLIRDTFSGRACRNHERGLKLVEYLREQTDSGSRIEYSPVTRLELTAGLLRGKAMLEAAREGTAHRMWSRMDEREILASLTSAHFVDISDAMRNLESDFDAGGVDLIEADPGKMSEVWTLAPQVLGIVFLDLGDCAIYASALLAEADEFITADGYFKEVVGYMENPGGAKPHQRAFFQDANGRMKTMLASAIGIGISDVTLPKASATW